jgi:hypothetical protein
VKVLFAEGRALSADLPRKGFAVTSHELIALWTVVVAIGALLVGTVAGLLSWLEDRRVPRAVLVGGSATGGAVALAVAIASVLT